MAYYVLVDAHTDECFFEKLTSGTKLLLTYEVIEGGFLDIDVKVRSNESNDHDRSIRLITHRLVDPIRKKSIVEIVNPVEKQHSLLLWMVRKKWIEISIDYAFAILSYFRYVQYLLW